VTVKGMQRNVVYVCEGCRGDTDMRHVLASLLIWMSLQSPAPDPWINIRALAGSWIGSSNGEPGSGSTVRNYEFVLNNRFLHVRNKSTYAAQPKNPKGEVHEDWGNVQLRFGTKETDPSSVSYRGIGESIRSAVGRA
jgi:hypothetical protein